MLLLNREKFRPGAENRSAGTAPTLRTEVVQEFENAEEGAETMALLSMVTEGSGPCCCSCWLLAASALAERFVKSRTESTSAPVVEGGAKPVDDAVEERVTVFREIATDSTPLEETLIAAADPKEQTARQTGHGAESGSWLRRACSVRLTDLKPEMAPSTRRA